MRTIVSDPGRDHGRAGVRQRLVSFRRGSYPNLHVAMEQWHECDHDAWPSEHNSSTGPSLLLRWRLERGQRLHGDGEWGYLFDRQCQFSLPGRILFVRHPTVALFPSHDGAHDSARQPLVVGHGHTRYGTMEGVVLHGTATDIGCRQKHQQRLRHARPWTWICRESVGHCWRRCCRGS
jgi:hypothetical protein